MRIVLQQKTSGLYFKDIESWTRHGSEAMDFVSSGAAIEFCVANRLSDLQVVCTFDEDKYKIVLTRPTSPDIPDNTRPPA